MTEPAKRPVMLTVHWPSGPVHACEEHARQLRGLASFLGAHVAVTAAPDNAECANCQNESGSSHD